MFSRAELWSPPLAPPPPPPRLRACNPTQLGQNVTCILKSKTLRDGHTIATTSRRPLTTTIFGVVAGGCRRSANVCRWSVTGCQKITSTTSRRPPTTTLFPGGFRWSANGCWWSPSSFGRPEVFDAASTTIDNQTRLPYKMNIHLILKNADDGELEEE